MLESGLLCITDENRNIVGTGFLVSKTHILTCAHVVCVALGIDAITQDHPSKAIQLNFPFFPGNPKHRAKVEAWYPAKKQMIFDELEDIALLRLESDPDQEGFFPRNARPLELASSKNNATSGLKVCGFSKGFDYGDTIEVRLLESNSELLVPIEFTSLNKFISSGFSGAPVWSESSHEVLGMVASKKIGLDRVKELNPYMIPAILLRRVYSLFCISN